MSKPTKLRKPPQFVSQGLIVAWCEDNGAARFVNLDRGSLFPYEDIPRFGRWLARAERWCKEKRQ